MFGGFFGHLEILDAVSKCFQRSANTATFDLCKNSLTERKTDSASQPCNLCKGVINLYKFL